MMKDWMDGGHGYVPDKKPDGVFRMIWENWNSIKYSRKRIAKEYLRLMKPRKRYNANIIGDCEPYVDWSMANSKQQFYELFGFGGPKKGKVAYNSNKHIKRCQQEGTAAMAFG